MFGFKVQGQGPLQQTTTPTPTETRSAKPSPQLRGEGSREQPPVGPKGMNTSERSGIVATFLKAISSSFQKVFQTNANKDVGVKTTGSLPTADKDAMVAKNQTIINMALRDHLTVERMTRGEAEKLLETNSQRIILRVSDEYHGFAASFMDAETQKPIHLKFIADPSNPGHYLYPDGISKTLFEINKGVTNFSNQRKDTVNKNNIQNATTTVHNISQKEAQSEIANGQYIFRTTTSDIGFTATYKTSEGEVKNERFLLDPKTNKYYSQLDPKVALTIDTWALKFDHGYRGNY